MKASILLRRTLFGVAACFFSASLANAQDRPSGIPALSSRPGADFTVYLNVGGFDFDGLWSGHATAPGYTAPLNDIPSNGSFSATEQAQIETIWAQMASSYVGFNVNVTTIDPYDSVGDLTPTDAERQAWYDQQPNLLHTVIGSQLRDDGSGGTVKWYSNDADGVSGLGVAAGVAPFGGDHTNWMFTEAQAGAATGGVINGGYIGAVSAHENAHAFGLNHQSDVTGTTIVNAYSLGDASAGDGSYVAIIGQADGRQRVGWRVGDASGDNGAFVQNDVAAMLSTSSVLGSGRAGAVDLAYVDDGIGGSMGFATPLPLSGNVIDVSSSNGKGVIVPLSNNPDPLGDANYTENWHSFYSDGGDAISLTVYNGTDFLTPGVSDLLGVESQAGMLRSVLSIFDSGGILVGMGVEDATTLFSSFTNLLSAGDYFARVTSYGGHLQDSPDYNSASYFDMGAYFLAGSGFDTFMIPEPTTAMLLVLSIGLATFRRASR